MNINPKSSKLVLVCALGMLAAFFVPWLDYSDAGMSGYNLGLLGPFGYYVWIVPALAAATVLLSVLGVSNRGIGAVCGIVPLGSIVYFMFRLVNEGQDRTTEGLLGLAGRVLELGAWLTIIFSVVIIIAAVVHRAGATTPTAQPEA